MRIGLTAILLVFVGLQLGKTQDTLFIYKKSGGVDFYLVSELDSMDFTRGHVALDTSTVINLPFDSIGTVADIDGNSYPTIKIGGQYWMAADLKVTRFSNGDPIPTTCPPTLDITQENNPIYQWAWQGIECNAKDYGRMYTWFVAGDARNVCPTGWHVPSDAEWSTLVSFVGGATVVGATAGGVALKDTVGWNNSAGNLNSVGFNARGGGYRDEPGLFDLRNEATHYWTSTWDPTLNTNGNGYPGVYRSFLEGDSKVYRYAHLPNHGFHIRCLKN